MIPCLRKCECVSLNQRLYVLRSPRLFCQDVTSNRQDVCASREQWRRRWIRQQEPDIEQPDVEEQMATGRTRYYKERDGAVGAIVWVLIEESVFSGTSDLTRMTASKRLREREQSGGEGRKKRKRRWQACCVVN